MKKVIISASLLAVTTIGFAQSTSAWRRSGDALGAGDFIGSTNAQPMIFRTNNIERMRISESGSLAGNLGIGTGAPKQKLHVNGSINLSNQGQIVFDNLDGVINWGAATGDLKFRVLNTMGNLLGSYSDLMVMQGQSGNVGIGTVTPTEKLDVNGNISLRGTHMVFNSQYGVIDWGSALGGDLYFRTLSSQGVIGGYTDRMCIKNNGAVGIGTSNPAGYLHLVTPAATGHGLLIQHNDPNPGYGEEIQVKNAGTKALLIANTNLNNYNEVFKVYGDGRTVIGNPLDGASPHASTYSLSVNGKVVCKEVVVTIANWADYVFARDYKLRNLNSLQNYVDENHHLPNVPSAKEINEKGVDLGEMSKIQMEKIEELTLYILELKKEIDELKNETK